MDSLLENLKQDVKCSLCNDTLTEPKILRCFHIFCKLCITRHAELIKEVNVFKCPKCKSETPLPEASSVESLKTSPVHSRISQVLTAIENEKVCSVSESHSAAVWYCFDCDQSICKDCLKGHSVFTKHHKLVRVNDMKNEDHESIVKKENNCTTHLNEILELYCEDCDDIICLSCWKEGHNDHKILSLDKLVLLKRALLYKHLEVLERLKFNDKERQKQEEIACKIKEDGERAKREVNENMARIIARLNESEREIQKEIDSKVDRAIRNLNIIHHIPAVKEYIKNILEKGLASEMVSIHETECDEDFIFNPIESCSGFAFIPNQTLLKQVNAGLGEIQSYSKTDHTRSTIRVEPEAVVLKQANLVLITRTSTGEPNHDPSDVIDVKLSPEENVVIKENYAKTHGKIEVEFMAKVAGQLTAEVQVNGQHVSNSPLVMNVEAQEMGITKEFKMKGRKVETLDMNGIAVNKENTRVAIADGYSHCVHVFNTDGDLLLTYGSQGRGSGQLQNPEGVAFLNDTDLVIADSGNYRISIVNTTAGILVKTFGSSGNGNGQFNIPRGVHVDDDGNIIVCDNGYGYRRVQVFTKDGEYLFHFGRSPQLGYTKRVQFHPACIVKHDGRFYVSDSTNHVIYVFEKKGGVMCRVSTFGGLGSAAGQLNEPWGLAIDNDHHLLVCDRGNNRIQKFTLDGRFVKRSASNIEQPSHIAALKDDQFLVSTYCSGVYFVK